MARCVARVQGPLDLGVEGRGPPSCRRGVGVQQTGHLPQRLGPGAGAERRHVDARRDDPDDGGHPGDELRAPTEDLGARADDRPGGLESLLRERPVAGLGPDRVLEVAPVDLRHVRARAERATPDRRARDPVAHDRDILAVGLGGGAERVHVRPQVRVEPVVGQIHEPEDLLEPLVVVDDEDRERLPDHRAQQHASAGGPVRVRVRPQLGRSVPIHGAGGIDPRVPVGMALLAQEHHVVPGRSPHLDDPGGRDVGTRPLEEPPVPHQDPHARMLGVGSRWVGSRCGR